MTGSPLMSGGPILTADGVAKLYSRRNETTRRRLGATAGRALFGAPPPAIGALRAHEFWAVEDVSFDLQRGEALGIIGLNGSGKTTLLRMLAGQLLPDKGEIRISGSSAAMIDLQAGFQPAASGRENIYLRAAALGFSKEQTSGRIDEIVAFSELAEAIEAPMATYSAGMKMRLAFSVMSTAAPDVLLIDEVLAVGDFRFRQKCLSKIREMRARSAFVFVSHSMTDVERFCDRVIVLHKGRIHFIGPPREAIRIYETLDSSIAASDGAIAIDKAMGPRFLNEQAISNVRHFWANAKGEPATSFDFADIIRLVVRFDSAIDIRNLIIGVPIWNANAHYTTGLSTQITSEKFEARAGETVSLMMEVDGAVLNPGVLRSMLGIVDGVEFLYRQPNPDLVIKAAPHPTWGAVTLPHRWLRVSAGAEVDSSNGPEDLAP